MPFTTTTAYLPIEADGELHIRMTFPTKPQYLKPVVVVFLHPLGSLSRSWEPFNTIVASDVPTIRIDFRGWGRSTGPADDKAYSITTLAQDVEQVIIQLDIEKYILVGHSIGTKVAQAIAERKRVVGLLGMMLFYSAPPTPLVRSDQTRDQQIFDYGNANRAEFVVCNALTSKDLYDAIVQTTIQGTY